MADGSGAQGERTEVFLDPDGFAASVERTCEAIRGEVFERGGALVRLVRSDGAPRADGAGFHPGEIMLARHTKESLRPVLARCAVFRVPDGRRRNNEPGARPPPDDLATSVLAAAGEGHFRVLRGVAQAPLMRPSGEIVRAPGYDELTRLWFDFPADALSGLPEAPTREDAEEAAGTILRVFEEFPFVSDDDRAVLLSAVLTCLLRPVLPGAPLHGFDAPTPGTGKTLAAELAAFPALGGQPATLGLAAEEEFDKRITSALLAGSPVALIDNVSRPMASDWLCSVLTSSEVAPRLLGTNDNRRLAVTSTFMATGNNLTLRGDLVRRSVVCRLDAGIERPEQRSFRTDVRREVTRRRWELVRAALTILVAYQAAGRPSPGARVLGGFDAWCSSVCSATSLVGSRDIAGG